MKIHFILLLFIILSGNIQAQEFKVYDNGLIYNEETMDKLRHISDSLNLFFKDCSLENNFKSVKQTKGHFINFNEFKKKKALIQDLENGISYKALVEKYVPDESYEDILIIKKEFLNSSSELMELYRGFIFQDYKEAQIYRSKTKIRKIGNWILDEQRYSLELFYILEDFQQYDFPDQYAKLINYADCLIDTTSSKMNEDAEQGYYYLRADWKNLDENEKKELLDTMRSTIVYGRCSRDAAPRNHAKNIALLSADVQQWEVFLKAHLDILNDNFSRLVDASYAQGGRETYIRELDELNINTQDLLLGISFLVENASPKHYFGNHARIGRAVATYKNKDVFYDRLSALMSDEELDDYNRLGYYFMYLNSIHHMNDSDKKIYSEKLTSAVNGLPPYLKNKIIKE